MTAESPIPEREKLPKESAAPPDTRSEGDGDDDHVARRGEVHTAMQEARDPCASDRAEEQEHDPTEDSLVDAAQEGADLPDEGEEHARDGCDAEDQRVGDLRQ